MRSTKLHGIPLAAHVLQKAVERAGIELGEIEDVVLGCGLPEGATGHNIARNAALAAGFGDAVPGVTVNRYCGSGLSAASISRQSNRGAARRASRSPAASESLSLVQFNLNFKGFFYEPLPQRMPAVWWTMNQTADFVAQKYKISRDALDAYVVESQNAWRRQGWRANTRPRSWPPLPTMKVTDKATRPKVTTDG